MAYPLPATPVVDWDNPLPNGTSGTAARDLVVNALQSLKAGEDTLAANDALTNVFLLGAGRIMGATIDTATNPVAGTGRTLRLLNDDYLIEGRFYTIANPEPSPYAVIANIPANKTTGTEVFVGLDDVTNLPVLATTFDTFPTSTADLNTIRGLLHVGRATTNATAVTAFVPSTRDNFGILRTPLGSITSGGGGDEDGITQEQLDAAIEAVTADYIARIAALTKLVTPGTQPKQQPVEDIYGMLLVALSEIARNQVSIAYMRSLLTSPQQTYMLNHGMTTRPFILEREQAAVIVAGAGSGEGDSPDFDEGDLSKSDAGLYPE